MRIKSFQVKHTGPVDLVQVSDIADVVVLAGPNGVGKTSVISALLTLAQYPNSQAIPDAPTWMIIEATTDAERAAWGADTLDTRVSTEASKLAQTLQRQRKRSRYDSSFLNFDSDRAIRNIANYGFTWDFSDPLLEEIGWNTGFSKLSDRHNEVRHSLFRIVEAQKREISNRALEMARAGQVEMSLDFPDVLKEYKDAFRDLLGPKELKRVDAQTQQITYEVNGQELSLESLSSGEREVVNVVFDFILRGPTGCVIMFDEPELHLHPELSYRLLQTLSRIGRNNQFVFSTHSPEIISASLENTVAFIRPKSSDGSNQAIIVRHNDETHQALQKLGQSIGVISLGKKLVLIEGDDASLDKQTYGAILKNSRPDLVLVPAGGKGTIRSFEEIRTSIINRTIWGVEFFLLCDRDAINSLGPSALAASKERQIKTLPRYHLENYFLDPVALSICFSNFEKEDSWLRDPSAIGAALREIAKGVVPYAVALKVSATFREAVGNVSLMPRGIDKVRTPEHLTELFKYTCEAERDRVNEALNIDSISRSVFCEFTRLMVAIENDEMAWREDIPGRVILNIFAAQANLTVGRLKNLYINAATSEQLSDDPFEEIRAIFASF